MLIHIQVGQGAGQIAQDITLQDAASGLGFSDGTAGGFDELAQKILILSNS